MANERPNHASTETPRYEGVLMVRGRGTGFISLPNFDEDILIERTDLDTAFDGDIVEIALAPTTPGERRSGKVLRILERAREEYIGTVEMDGNTALLKPDGKRIHTDFVLPEATKDDAGMKVAIALTEWTNKSKKPSGRIIETLGKAGVHETEMRAIIRSGGFASDFPKEVQDAAQKLYEQKEYIFADALNDEKRRDMRAIPTCTIDPEDAKDFDDALSVRTLDSGLVEIGIHIADVSHYVRENEPIDKEAQERGTSVYLVDRVIPMLPEILSNDLCSLRPNEDRLSFSAVFTMDTKGVIQEQWFGQTIINSDKRFSYAEAQSVLDAGTGTLHTELRILMDISRFIRTKRYEQGAIAFEQPEVKFTLDEDGVPIDVSLKERIETMLMIEDFMLLANRRVAEHIHTHAKAKGRDAAFIYRIHDAPNPEKIEELATFLHALGYEFRTKHGIVDAKDINVLLKQIEGSPEETLIKTATIRSMAKAIYSTKNIGHFGLAFKYYTHFTSPIRRYPDLMAHRMLRRHLDNSPITSKEMTRYERLSVQSSEREMHAVTAERDSIKYKQVEYMKGKVGQTFTGVISGVTEWGIYVEEKESRAEGMIKLASIKSDFFTYDKKAYRVRGEKTGKTYRLGDELTVKLTQVNLEDRQLDFTIV